jgi:hypothetical protein
MKNLFIVIGIVALSIVLIYVIIRMYMNYVDRVERRLYIEELEREEKQRDLERKLAYEREQKMLREMTDDEIETYALKKIKEHGTVHLSYMNGIQCEDYLLMLGVDTCMIEYYLKEMDYCECSIMYDDEYHLTKDIDKAIRKIKKELKGLDLEYCIG